jgi:hypothetical protein
MKGTFAPAAANYTTVSSLHLLLLLLLHQSQVRQTNNPQSLASSKERGKKRKVDFNFGPEKAFFQMSLFSHFPNFGYFSILLSNFSMYVRSLCSSFT